MACYLFYILFSQYCKYRLFDYLQDVEGIVSWIKMPQRLHVLKHQEMYTRLLTSWQIAPFRGTARCWSSLTRYITMAGCLFNILFLQFCKCRLFGYLQDVEGIVMGLMFFWPLYKCVIHNKVNGQYMNNFCFDVVYAKLVKYALIFRHYNDVTMSAMASQITSLTILYSVVYSNGDQRKHQSSASLAFVRGIHRWPVNSPHKWPVTRKCFHLMTSSWLQVHAHTPIYNDRTENGLARLLICLRFDTKLVWIYGIYYPFAWCATPWLFCTDFGLTGSTMISKF